MTLTPRQRQVVRLLAEGYTCPRIAAKLQIAERTVRTHIENIAAKVPGRLTPIARIVSKADELLEAA